MSKAALPLLVCGLALAGCRGTDGFSPDDGPPPAPETAEDVIAAWAAALEARDFAAYADRLEARADATAGYSYLCWDQYDAPWMPGSFWRRTQELVMVANLFHPAARARWNGRRIRSITVDPVVSSVEAMSGDRDAADLSCAVSLEWEDGTASSLQADFRATIIYDASRRGRLHGLVEREPDTTRRPTSWAMVLTRFRTTPPVEFPCEDPDVAVERWLAALRSQNITDYAAWLDPDFRFLPAEAERDRYPWADADGSWDRETELELVSKWFDPFEPGPSYGRPLLYLETEWDPVFSQPGQDVWLVRGNLRLDVIWAEGWHRHPACELSLRLSHGDDGFRILRLEEIDPDPEYPSFAETKAFYGDHGASAGPTPGPAVDLAPTSGGSGPAPGRGARRVASGWPEK